MILRAISTAIFVALTWVASLAGLALASENGQPLVGRASVVDGDTIEIAGERIRIKAYTNYDNYVGVGTWTKVAINNTDYNDQGAFDTANNRFVAPADGTYLFGATLMYKVNASTTARMRGRLVLNGTTEIRGSMGAISATHVSLATAIWLQTMVALSTGDTVELQGDFRVADGYVAAGKTAFWGRRWGESSVFSRYPELHRDDVGAITDCWVRRPPEAT